MTKNITGKLGAKTVMEKCPPEVYFGVSAEQSYPNLCRTLQNAHIGNDLDGPFPIENLPSKIVGDGLCVVPFHQTKRNGTQAVPYKRLG